MEGRAINPPASTKGIPARHQRTNRLKVKISLGIITNLLQLCSNAIRKPPSRAALLETTYRTSYPRYPRQF